MEDFTFSDFRNFVREITDFSRLFSQMQETGELSIEIKNDKTPVTEIDFQIVFQVSQPRKGWWSCHMSYLRKNLSS